MVVDREFLSLKDVAELCGTSSSNVSNWRTRDVKFPTPYTETAAGPLWKALDIVKYLQTRSKEYDVIASGNLLSKSVALVGRARVGKSFIVSRFVEDRSAYTSLFCGDSTDKTPCPIYVKISEYVTVDTFIFHSNFNSISSQEDLSDLKRRVSETVDRHFYMDNAQAMEAVENIIREIRDLEEKYPNRRKSNTYIETYQRPNEFCREILRKCKIGAIQFVDTQGVSGEIEASKIAKSDLYMFVLRPDNETEATTLKKIVELLKPDIATSKVAFLYKVEGYFFTKEKYFKAQEKAKEAMQSYTSLFDDLKGSIIATDVDVLDPAGHCIVFPTMDAEDLTPPEHFFLEEVSEKMIAAFTDDDSQKKENEFRELMKKYGDPAKSLVNKVLSEIPPHIFGGKDDFTIENVRNNRHDRVKSADNYRLHNVLYTAYQKEMSLLDEYFSQYRAEDYPEDWQKILIKYLYRTLTNSIRTDRGLGVGTHPWEDYPARTMLVEESIFAQHILEAISNRSTTSWNTQYKDTLQSCGIKSATWNYVGCTDDEEALTKLRIIESQLASVKVSNIQEMVLCRYIGGLRKIAEYNILMLLGHDKNESMMLLANMPF